MQVTESILGGPKLATRSPGDRATLTALNFREMNMALRVDTGIMGTMNRLDIEDANRETNSVHWRALFAGLAISLLLYLGMLSLGIAIGSDQLLHVLNGQDAQGLGAGAVIWMVLTVILALFVGSYASGRVSGLIASRVGYIQGAVISALFFVAMASQIGAAIGFVGRSVSSISRGVGGAVSDLSSSSTVTLMIQDALQGTELKAPLEHVARGFVTRLISGDQEAAMNYLSQQTGVSRAEAEERFSTLSAQVRETAKAAADSSAQTARGLGWMVFTMILLGTISSMFGGGLGAQRTIRSPVDRMDESAVRTSA